MQPLLRHFLMTTLLDAVFFLIFLLPSQFICFLNHFSPKQLFPFPLYGIVGCGVIALVEIVCRYWRSNNLRIAIWIKTVGYRWLDSTVGTISFTENISIKWQIFEIYVTRCLWDLCSECECCFHPTIESEAFWLIHRIRVPMV